MFNDGGKYKVSIGGVACDVSLDTSVFNDIGVVSTNYPDGITRTYTSSMSINLADIEKILTIFSNQRKRRFRNRLNKIKRLRGNSLMQFPCINYFNAHERQSF